MSNLREASGPSTDDSHQAVLSRGEVLNLIREQTRFRTGIGYDVHRFVEGRPLILGGVSVPYHLGLLGHSDADVLTHAAMDAILGASGCSDIGTYFPDDDSSFAGADSLKLAQRVVGIITTAGFILEGLDLMIIAEAPKLKPYVPEMKANLSKVFGLEEGQLGLKATTNEKMGWVGRGEGIACLASALVRQVSEPSPPG